MQLPAKLVASLACMALVAQPTAAAPVEAKIETGERWTTAAVASSVTPASAVSSVTIVSTSNNITFVTSTSSSSTSAGTVTKSAPTSIVAVPTPATNSTSAPETKVQPRESIDYSKKLVEYLDYQTKDGDKLPGCCKECFLSETGKGVFTIHVRETSLEDFCNKELESNSWLGDYVEPCVRRSSTCEEDDTSINKATHGWTTTLCPGKFGN